LITITLNSKQYMLTFPPSHPGDLIRETIIGLHDKFGKKYTMEEIAEGLGTTRKTLSAIINKRQGVTPEMALRLAAAFRNTTAEYWLDLSTENVRVLWDPANRKSSRAEKV
jgi:addiction module HigA family antidote